MIRYTLQIQADWLILAEEIEKACNFAAAFHENIADELFEKFGGYQVITATHRNVTIETRRGTL